MSAHTYTSKGDVYLKCWSSWQSTTAMSRCDASAVPSPLPSRSDIAWLDKSWWQTLDLYENVNRRRIRHGSDLERDLKNEFVEGRLDELPGHLRMAQQRFLEPWPWPAEERFTSRRPWVWRIMHGSPLLPSIGQLLPICPRQCSCTWIPSSFHRWQLWALPL